MSEQSTATPASDEVVVIGAGPGGYATALGLAQAGRRVRLVDAGGVGGTCLRRGCIPTKTLLESARVADAVRRAAEFGVACGDPVLRPAAVLANWPAIRARQARVVGALAGGLEALLRGAGVTIQRGWATLRLPGADGAPRVHVAPVEPGGGGGGTLDLAPDAVVLAPGATAARPPFPGRSTPGVVDSDGLLALEECPRRLCIVGGGAIGCEFASAFADLGTEVTIVEALPQLLPRAEPEAARRLQAAFRRRGIAVSTGARVLGIVSGPVVRIADGGSARELPADVVLVAVGRHPATAGLGLTEAGVRLGPSGEIQVDRAFSTTASRVWAVGDALGGPMVAHAAFHQAATVVAAMAGAPPAPVPALAQPVFCWPEVAWVGCTEAEARAAGAEVRVARVPFAALGRAHAAGETDGFCKLVADAGGRLLGAHLVGAHATELIGAACVALSLGAAAQALLDAGFPHPTLSEALGETAGLLLGRPLHVPSAR